MKEFFKKIIVSILIFEASLLLQRKKPKIIAITGSVGKTSTKDAIFAVLKNQVHVRKSEKNYNSDIGASLTILGLDNAWSNPVLWIKVLVEGALRAFFEHEYPDVLILELGIDRPGDMKKLVSFIKPDIAVLTRLPDVPVHVEYFDTPEAVAKEKMLMVDALKKDGVLIYNNDDEIIRSSIADVRQQSFGFSRYSPSHFTASADKIVYDGSLPAGAEFTITHIDEAVRVHIKDSLGTQHTYNYTAAVAVGAQFSVSLQDAAQALSQFVAPAGRMKLVSGVQSSVIIDDTYNSSPVACERALQTLQEIKGAKRKIAVLGDMLELGHFSVVEHERIGALVPASADILLTLGLRSRKIAEGALEHGMSEKNIFQYDDPHRAGEELKAMVQPGDIILIKGSQSIRAEIVTKALMANPKNAPKLLVRQESAWEKRS